MVTKRADFKGFTQVEASSAFELTITRGNSYSVVVRIAKELEPCLKMKQSGDKLKFGLKSGCCKCDCSCNSCMQAEISMPALSALKLNGAAQVELKGFDRPADLQLRLSGAAAVKGEFKARKADFKLSGASSVDLEGSADQIDLNASGACRVKLSDFPASEAEVDFSGASTGTIKATQSLEAECSGVSTLTYLGNPQTKRIHTSGMSHIHKG